MASRITVTHKTPAQLAVGGTDISDTSFGRSWQTVLSDVGFGSVSLQNDDANLAAIDYGDYVQFALDGTPRFLMQVEGLDTVAISDDEEVGEVTTISGRSHLAEWEGAVVDPPNGIAGLPTTGDRVFNYASAELDVSGWSAAVEIYQQGTYPPLFPPEGWYGDPTGWPDPSGFFMWSRAYDSMTGQPVGFSYFVKDIPVATAGVHSIYIAGDNGYRLWVDGVMIAEVEADITEGGAGTGEGYQLLKRADLYLDAGTHRFAIEGHNLDDFADMTQSAAGVLFAIYDHDPATGLDDTLISRSDSFWKANDYPANPPGFTVGEVIRILLEDAQADGELTGWSLGFTDTLDSDGVAWPADQSFSFPVGTDLLTVLRQLGETDIDFAADPTSLTLDAWLIGTKGVAAGAETATLGDLGFLEFQGRA